MPPTPPDGSAIETSESTPAADHDTPGLPPGLVVIPGAAVPPLAFAHPAPFDPTAVEPIRNVLAVSGKPDGGAWLCPVETEINGEPVTAWSRRDDYRLTVTRVTLDLDASVLVLDSAADLDLLHEALPPPFDLAEHLRLPAELLPPGFGMIAGTCDWEALAALVDAVWATPRCVHSTKHRREGPSLNTWDVESVFVLNAAVTDVAATAGERSADPPYT